MAIPHQDVYRVDPAGRRRLAGLTFEETNEFHELERLLDQSLSARSLVRWTEVQEVRFVELLLRYELALQNEAGPSEGG